MRIIRFFQCLILVGLLGLSCNSSHKPGNLTIAVSSNMQFSMEAIATSFTDTYGIPCSLVIGSSGKLTAQIMEGAPFDVFLSADMKYPQELFKNGHASSSPKVYAHGKLVLYSPNGQSIPSLDLLLNDSIANIAMANPQTAPYGMAAMKVMKRHGILDVVKEKLVYGENVSQTNQFLTTGAAQIGFTAKSTIVGTGMVNQGSWLELDTDSCFPMEQGIVLLNSTLTKPDSAELFFKFIFSPEAQEILKKYGYSVHE